MNFETALEFMHGRIRHGWKLGLERFTELCRRLGSPQNEYKIIHITGTKGKGSTTAMAAAILAECGYRTGAYFSPYVYDVRERVQINGVPISKEDFARLITEIKPHLDLLDETDFGAVTEFELKTALGFLHFAQQKAEVVCLEVGIGGRLDATNIVSPSVCAITNIGLDHTQILGDTHAKIAFEKAGILKPGVPSFTAVRHPDAFAVIKERAAQVGSPLTRILREGTFPDEKGAVRWRIAEGDPHTANLTVTTLHAEYAEIPVNLIGDYQRENAACAIASAESVIGDQIPLSALRTALEKLTLPGRLEVYRKPNEVLLVLDGAHNGMAAEALSLPLASLREKHGIKGVRLVVGMLNGHDATEVITPIVVGVRKAYVCAPGWKRAQSAEELAEVVKRFVPQTEIYATVKEAVTSALQEAEPHEMVLVTGSFYTVGEVPEPLRNEEAHEN